MDDCDEGHCCCNKRLEEEGGTAKCCYCYPHETCQFKECK